MAEWTPSSSGQQLKMQSLTFHMMPIRILDPAVLQTAALCKQFSLGIQSIINKLMGLHQSKQTHGKVREITRELGDSAQSKRNYKTCRGLSRRKAHLQPSFSLIISKSSRYHYGSSHLTISGIKQLIKSNLQCCNLWISC